MRACLTVRSVARMIRVSQIASSHLPTSRGFADQNPGRVRLMLRLVVCCCALVVCEIGVGSPARAEEEKAAPLAALLHGVWEGQRDGTTVVLELDGEARLRLDGRPADFEIRSDTLLVRFDAIGLAGSASDRETAVYRFMASVSPNGPSRLYVYGFDLGRTGVQLTRAPEPEPSEDAAPPVPEVPKTPIVAPLSHGGTPHTAALPVPAQRRDR